MKVYTLILLVIVIVIVCEGKSDQSNSNGRRGHQSDEYSGDQDNSKNVSSERSNPRTKSSNKDMLTKSTDNDSRIKSTDKNSRSKSTDNDSRTKSTDKNSRSKSTDNDSRTKSTDKNSRTKSTDKNSRTKSTDKNSRTKSTDNDSRTRSTDKDTSEQSKSNGSNEDELICVINNVLYPVGTFTDPNDKCRNCTCDMTGNVSCKTRQCMKPKCGEDFLVPTNDGCCMQCSDECITQSPKCPKLKCKSKHSNYPKDSCCPKCGCRDKTGDFVPEGPVKTEDPCDKCTCKKGKINCKPPICAGERLQCVNPTRDENCNYMCPDGKTCSKNGVVIPYGEIRRVGKKICTCAGEWFPKAFCARARIPKHIRKKQKNMCVAKSIIDIMEVPEILETMIH